ncbi:MAG TPA: hypothetical protein VGQ76_09470 [Thermoanaerobaculia bacterium]|nr:hypothetical protein [Thermoanaerobaculia bacterium]
MTEHLTERDLADFSAGRMEPRRIQAAGAHVRSCETCAAAVDRSRALARSAAELWDHATEESEATTPQRVPVRWWPAIAAAAAVLAVILGFLLFARKPQSTPTPEPPRATARPPKSAPPVPAPELSDGPYRIRISNSSPDVAYGRPEWDALAREAIIAGRITVAQIAALHSSGEQSRGSDDDPDTTTLLEPTGVVASQRPTFRWKGPAGAEYSVVIAREGSTPVAKSDRMRTTSWTPTHPLARGVTYEWQVTVFEKSGRTQIVPTPPAPRALFAILSSDATREVDEARNAGAHLIAALLYAREGARADALREASAFAAENPDSPIAAALQKSLAAQRGEPTRTNADQ